MGRKGLLAVILVVALAVLAVSVTTLVFTLLDHFDKPEKAEPVTPSKRPTPSANSKVKDTPGFKILSKAIDESVDPCEDFYQYACGNYLKNNPIPDNAQRIGTYDETQKLVDQQIIDVLSKDIDTESETLKVTKYIFDQCVAHANLTSDDHTQTLKDALLKDINGFPALEENWKAPDDEKVWTLAGQWQTQYDIQTLLTPMVTADYGNVSQLALFFSPPELDLPLDYYIKPTFQGELKDHRDEIASLLKKFYAHYKNENDKRTPAQIDAAIEKGANDIVGFEVSLAMNFVPDDLLKNFHIQYNKFSYDELLDLKLQGVISELGLIDVHKINYVVLQPRYFESLPNLIKAKEPSAIYNYLAYRFIANFDQFIPKEVVQQLEVIRSIKAKPRKVDASASGAESRCISTLRKYMPYGPGFVYINSIDPQLRKNVVDDVTKQTDLVLSNFLKGVDTLAWMTKEGKDAVKDKAKGLERNIGFPDFFNTALDNNTFDDLDNYHRSYGDLLHETVYFELLYRLVHAHQLTEGIGLLNLPERGVNRKNFQESPSTVNAWYAPELNSITIPFAALNPPYYRYDFPQSYNYAGQGGTFGHELTHGFDSDGVQFGKDGTLSNGKQCNLEYCTWLDGGSTAGFLNMAQCVISQYSEQCCPLSTGNVHCANGDTTQGENIADIGGQLAAYAAYRQWVAEHNNGAEEELVPGLETYTPNQVFWLTYGYSWCMNQREDVLVNQILTNPHAPAKCRVNQVVQDLPQFAKDFGCRAGQALFPPAEKRCKVWTGV